MWKLNEMFLFLFFSFCFTLSSSFPFPVNIIPATGGFLQKKLFFRTFAIFTGRHLCRSHFLRKLRASIRAHMFSYEYYEILKSNNCERQLLQTVLPDFIYSVLILCLVLHGPDKDCVRSRNRKCHRKRHQNQHPMSKTVLTCRPYIEIVSNSSHTNHS